MTDDRQNELLLSSSLNENYEPTQQETRSVQRPRMQLSTSLPLQTATNSNILPSALFLPASTQNASDTITRPERTQFKTPREELRETGTPDRLNSNSERRNARTLNESGITRPKNSRRTPRQIGATSASRRLLQTRLGDINQQSTRSITAEQLNTNLSAVLPLLSDLTRQVTLLREEVRQFRTIASDSIRDYRDELQISVSKVIETIRDTSSTGNSAREQQPGIDVATIAETAHVSRLFFSLRFSPNFK